MPALAFAVSGAVMRRRKTWNFPLKWAGSFIRRGIHPLFPVSPFLWSGLIGMVAYFCMRTCRLCIVKSAQTTVGKLTQRWVRDRRTVALPAVLRSRLTSAANHAAQKSSPSVRDPPARLSRWLRRLGVSVVTPLAVYVRYRGMSEALNRRIVGNYPGESADSDWEVLPNETGKGKR